MEKENKIEKSSKIITIIFLFLTYILHYYIFLCGDDFMYGTFSHKNILNSVGNYYFTGNGRWFINIMDSCILFFDKYLFMLLNPLLIILFVYLLVKITMIITDKKNFNQLFIVGLLFVSSMNILLSREVLYWITGMMNYLFPSILFLGSYYCYLRNKRELQENHKLEFKWKLLFFILSFFSGASVEQFSLMYCGVVTLDLGYRFLKKDKIYKFEWFGYLLSIIGLCTILFAPGNFIRVEAAKNKNSLFIKILDLIYNNYNSIVVSNIILIISLLSFFISEKFRKSRFLVYINRINIGMVLVRLILTHINLLQSLNNKLIFINIVFFFIILINIVYNDLQQNNRVILFSLFFVGIGSQIMLLISEIWGFRISFSMYIIFYIFILYLISKFDSKLIPLMISAILLLDFNCILSIILMIFIFCLKEKINNKIANVLICSCIIMFQIQNIKGYRDNSCIHIDNTNEAYSNKEIIYIKSFKNDLYGWTNPPFSKFHENYFRKYYSINKNVEIKYLK